MLHPRYQWWQGGNRVDKYKQLINGFLVHIIYIYIIIHIYIYTHTRIYRQREREREKDLSACAVRACVRRYVCGCVGVCVCVCDPKCNVRYVSCCVPPHSATKFPAKHQTGPNRHSKSQKTRHHQAHHRYTKQPASAKLDQFFTLQES